jgi:hypothetical protein
MPFGFLPCCYKYPPPPGGEGKETQALSNHMQVVGLCPTPHKLFEKSLIKNFTKVDFVLLLALTIVLPKPACDERAKMTARSSGAGEYLSG